MEYKYKKLTPFKMQCLTNFPFIDEDFDALSNYGLLCKIVEYLNEISKNNNTLIDNIDSLNNWFKNLDVQDEINNKLDEMAEDGTLDQIIAQYLNLNAILGFNTVTDMKNATNLINGSYAQTLGYYAKNDGGDALYKIRTKTNEDVIDEQFIIEINNTLIAELIYEADINILKLGADKTGTNDISTIINKCINKDDIQTIYIPNGTYKINSTITLISGIKICGDNPTINFTGTGNLFTSSQSVYNITLINLKFNGNLENNFATFNGIIDSNFENLRISNFSNGITLQNSWDNTFRNMRLQNCATPLKLNSQTNNMTFVSCYFVSFTSTITLTNSEGITFIGCDIANNETTYAVSVYQSICSFINCYFENLNDNNTFKGGYNESVKSSVSFYNCHITDEYLTFKPYSAYVEFNNFHNGYLIIGTVATTSDPMSIGNDIPSLTMPSNYYAKENNSVYYFDGKKEPTIVPYGNTSVIPLTKTFENSVLTLKYENNNLQASMGFNINDLEVGKKYLLILEGDTPDDTSLIFWQEAGYSVSRNLNNSNYDLILPFTALNTTMHVRWSFTGDFNIKKLIVQEFKKYI